MHVRTLQIYLLYAIVLGVFVNFGLIADTHRARVVGIVDYIRGDYPVALRDGQVVDATEYQEMLEFSRTAVSLFESDTNAAAQETDENKLLRAAAAQNLALLVEAIQQRQPYVTVLEITGKLKAQLVHLFAIAQVPKHAPGWELGQSVYREHCSGCHGTQGAGDGSAAVQLSPKPRSFLDPTVMATASPFKFYNTLRTGIAGTAMRSFSSELGEDELWSVAFYSVALQFMKSDAEHTKILELWRALPPDQFEALERAHLSVFELASMSETELLLWLDENVGGFAARTPREREFTIRVLRTSAPFLDSVPLSAPDAQGGQAEYLRALAFTQKKIAAAKASFAQGDRKATEMDLLDAYLEGFEKVEAFMRVIHPEVVHGVESAFLTARSQAVSGSIEEFHLSIAHLETKLESAEQFLRAGGESKAHGFRAFVSSFIIIFREGLEAFLIIAALLALLVSLGQSQARVYIHGGWISALVAGALSYWLLNVVLQLSGAVKESLEAICNGLAVVVLLYTGFWLLSQTEHRKWQAYVKARSSLAISSGRIWTLFTAAFIAAYREAAETALFYSALLNNTNSPWMVLAGFLAGVAALLVIGQAFVRQRLRIPLRKFFIISSILMLVIAFVLFGKTVHELIIAGYLRPFPIAWIPEIELLGIYPDLTSLGAQAILFTLGALATLAMRYEKKR